VYDLRMKAIAKNTRRGRPTGTTKSPEDRKMRVNITISTHHRAVAEMIGENNLSGGLEKALDFWVTKNLKKFVK
jgi:hypothetical protein